MKNLMSTLTAIAVLALVVCFTACTKMETDVIPQVQDLPMEEQKTPFYDESNSKLVTWDQLPEALRNAIPITELEPNHSSSLNRTSQSNCPNYLSASTAYGGNGGRSFRIEPHHNHQCSRIFAIAIQAGSRVDRMVVWYESRNGTIYVGGDVGGNGGRYYIQYFSQDEYIHKVKLRYQSRINRIEIFTNHKDFAYGGDKGYSRPIAVSQSSNKHILGFYGNSGSEIDRLGCLLYSK